MAQTLPNGVVVPNADGGEQISATGVQEMRTLGASADAAIADARFTKTNPGPFDFDTMKTPGTYSLGSPFPDGYTNVPEGITTASILNVYGSPVQSWCAQELIQYGANPIRLWRVSRNTAVWNPWVQVGGGGDVSSAMGGNAARQSHFVSTTGGPVSTGGKAAFALRLDHGWTNIKSKLRAGLIARGIVPGVASCSRQWDLAENSGATIAEVKSWVAAGEFEILNQGATHGQNMVNYVDEIVNGRVELEDQLDTDVWGFAPPGESTTWEDFDGGRVDGWASLPAAIMLASHAYSMGYVGGARRVLDGTIRQGLSHITLDTYDMAQARAQVDAAISEGRGIQVMLHPRELDKAGKITTAQFLSFLDYVVGKRDAGDLVTLTPGELVRADATPPPAVADVTGLASRLDALDEATWYRGNLTVEGAAENLPNGEYRVASGAVAQALGLPMNHHGILHTITNAAMTWGQQTYDTMFNVRWARRIEAGAWLPWDTTELPDIPAPWYRGILDDTGNADTVEDGSYRIASSAAAGVLGLPEAQQGLLESWSNGSTRTWMFQRFTTILGSRWTRVYAGGRWLDWAALDAGGDTWYRRALTIDDDIDALDSGAYRVAAGSVAQALGLPDQAHGIVTVWQNGSLTWGLRTFVTLTGTTWTASINSGAWTAWSRQGGAPSGSTGLTMSRGVQRQSQALAIFRARMMKRDTEPIPIVFAGDSETRGEGATSNATRYVDRLVAYLQGKYPSASGSESTVQDRTGGAPFSPRSGPGIHGYCMGRGGTQADTYLTDADTVNIAAIDPAMIIHQVALNDYARRRPIAQYRADLIHRIDHLDAALTRPCVHVFSLTYPRQDVTAPNPEWHEYGDALRSIAAERPESVAFLDMSPAFAAMGIPGTDPFGLLVADQIHTSDDGYEMMADCVAIGIEEK